SSAPAAPSLLGLELLRFACAISVLVWHYNHFYVAGQAHVGFTLTAQPLYGLLKPFYEAGWLGVQVFWALSGFIFFWKYAQPVQAGQVPAWRFAVLRFSRLYPLHLITLLAVAAMAWTYRQAHGVDYVYAFNDWPHFILQLFLASDWPGRSEWSFNGPIWSVSIEVLVYGLFFGLCRLGLTRWWQVLGVIAAAGAIYASKRTEHPLVLCVFFFYLGALTHLAHEALGRLTPRLQQGLAGMAVLLLAGGTALTAQGLLRPMFYTALLAPLAMVLLLRWVQPGPGRVATLITTLGHTTYASYLLHFPLQLLVACLSWGQPERLPLGEPVWLLGYLGVTFALAVGVYRWVEVPAQAALRARLLARPGR
ncbi:acyltransferase, partial [Aquabacterium sp.]|uniref:acyltransferase family protein n=1 Tax=Aquabacterium sp. TaxID=1872578 RepID=UPI0025BCE5F9